MGTPYLTRGPLAGFDMNRPEVSLRDQARKTEVMWKRVSEVANDLGDPQG